MKHLIERRESEKGFTLVELAIVMIIIGLLIGGVLKGQELINNAQISSTLTQVKAVDSAIGAFKDAYAALPGDISQVDARSRIPSCSACTGGNSNNRILENGATAVLPFSALPGTSEQSIAWTHLTNGNFLQGGSNEVSLGGVMTLTYHTGGNMPAVTGVGQGTASPGHYVIFADGADAQGDILNATQAARLDRKTDDGSAVTGSTQAVGACLAETLINIDDGGDGSCDAGDPPTCQIGASVFSYDEAGDTASGLCRLATGLSF